LEAIFFTRQPSSDTNESLNGTGSYLLRGSLHFIFGGLLYAAAAISSPIYYIPAVFMTITFVLYLMGFLMKHEFKRSIVTFYVMLGTGAAFLV
jgi:hypothetical protein